MKKCVSPICRKEFEEYAGFKGRWCCKDCYLSDLDEYLERKFEAQLEGKMLDEWRKSHES